MHYPELWFKGISNHIQDWRRLAREARRNAQQLTKPYSVIKILLFRCAIFTLPFSLTVDIHAMLWVISLLPHLLCIVSFCLSRNVTLAWWLICHHYFRDCLLIYLVLMSSVYLGCPGIRQGGSDNFLSIFTPHAGGFGKAPWLLNATWNLWYHDAADVRIWDIRASRMR